MLAVIIPIAAVQILLQAYCISDLVRRESVRFANKKVWGAVILLLGFIGCAIYITTKGDE